MKKLTFSKLAMASAAGLALVSGFNSAPAKAVTPAIPTPAPLTGAPSTVLGTVNADGKSAGGLGGTFTYSSSAGQNNNFAVGTSSNFGVNASASSTSDYKVQSTANVGANGSSLTQGIGTSFTSDVTGLPGRGPATATDSGVISGSFKSSEMMNNNATMKQIDTAAGGNAQNLNDTSSVGSLNSTSNTVEVKGVSNNANIKTDANSKFTADVGVRNTGANVGTSNSATANGGAGASLSTTATANSSTTQYVSTFIQAF